MFLLPFYQKIDWSNPPLVTILLILLNTFVYFVIQADDDRYTLEAMEYYLEQSQLADIEIPHYIRYLENKGDHKKAAQYDYVIQQQNRNESLQVVFAMITDNEFVTRLSEHKIITPADEKFKLWQKQHQEFYRRLDKIVWFNYGMRAGQPDLLTSFTHMFLHGSAEHLIGNMLFLFILGFVVEMVLGKSIYLFSYILAGLGSATLDMIINSDSIIPSIGASGAIAGVMGMYTVLFGLRKINFFYFIIVYFDYIKAPAIILFPVWLGNELYQMFYGAPTNVNYLAHIGGLLSGGSIAVLIKQFTDWVNTDYMDAEAKQESRNDLYEDALNYLSKLQYDKAAKVFMQLHQQQPENRQYLIELYKAAKYQPNSHEYHFAARKIFLLSARDKPTSQLILDTYREYLKLCKNNARFTPDLLFDLTIRFTKNGYLDEANLIARNLLVKKTDDKRMPGILLSLALAYKNAKNIQSSQYYTTQLLKLYPHSNETLQLQALHAARTD